MDAHEAEAGNAARIGLEDLDAEGAFDSLGRLPTRHTPVKEMANKHLLRALQDHNPFVREKVLQVMHQQHQAAPGPGAAAQAAAASEGE